MEQPESRLVPQGCAEQAEKRKRKRNGGGTRITGKKRSIKRWMEVLKRRCLNEGSHIEENGMCSWKTAMDQAYNEGVRNVGGEQ